MRGRVEPAGATVRVLGKADAQRFLGVASDAPLVAYESENAITNAGTDAWTRDAGLLSIWNIAVRSVRRTWPLAPASD